MDKLSWEELIELGLSVPTRRLIEWSREQYALAASKKERLLRRGVTPLFLAEVGVLVDSVQKHHSQMGGEAEKPAPDLQAIERIRRDAVSYWEEVKQIAKIEFGTDPEALARFRIGVRTGPSIGRLSAEIERQVSLLREYSKELNWLGVNVELVQKGEALVSMLREALGKVHSACRTLPSPVLELCEEKGRLYTLTRKLVRIGRLEFMREPELAAAFNYDTLRMDRPVYSPARAKPERASAR